ncbi:MAG: helix-turn-helix domain-containing protein [Frankiales bacterium]|nr:helix-turn-helix domain-containing protein [Frankiales bacterium]
MIMEREELAGLPALLDVPDAARVLGIGRSLAYELVRRGEWPTAVLRFGRLIKIPSGPLLRLVESGPDAPATQTTKGSRVPG